MKHYLSTALTILLLLAMIGCTNRYQRHFELGKWYYQKGLINEAILEFKAATRANPNHHLAHHNLAIAYAKKGWYEYALKEAEIAFDLHPTDETYNLIELVREKKSLEKQSKISPEGAP